jgi:hypothetical protein
VALTTRGTVRKENISLDKDEGTTPTRTWVKEMRSKKNFWRNCQLKNIHGSPQLHGKIDDFFVRREISKYKPVMFQH